MSSLFADQYCGVGTSLIIYAKPGSVLSRGFTSKDTHSPRGDLLVVHSGEQESNHDAELSRHTEAVLGFETPSFVYGTDLMLPAGANYDLRNVLVLGSEPFSGDRGKHHSSTAAALKEMLDFDHVSAIPQVFGASSIRSCFGNHNRVPVPFIVGSNMVCR